MNRRNFFSLALLALGAVALGRLALRPTPTPTPTVRPAVRSNPNWIPCDDPPVYFQWIADAEL